MGSNEGHVVVIGSAGIDMKGRPAETLAVGAPTQGQVGYSLGGVARNIAENLARLEVPTLLLGAVGADMTGKHLIGKTRKAGVNCDHVKVVRGGRTGTYLALLTPEGQLHAAVSDFAINQSIDPDYILLHEPLFAHAAMIVIDATLDPETLDTVFRLASRYKVRVAADPTTPELAGRLCPFLPNLFLTVPNSGETAQMCGHQSAAYDRDSALQAARELVSGGVQIAVVTLGAQGLAYADAHGGGFIRAAQTTVLDATGAGDAFCAAVIFGLLNDVEVDEAMRLGATAAALTVESRHTVYPRLSQELLYDKLIV